MTKIIASLTKEDISMFIRRASKRERIQKRLQKIREKKTAVMDKMSEQYEICQQMHELYMRDSSYEAYTERIRKIADRAIARLDNRDRNLSIAESKSKRELKACLR